MSFDNVFYNKLMEILILIILAIATWYIKDPFDDGEDNLDEPWSP